MKGRPPAGKSRGRGDVRMAFSDKQMETWLRQVLIPVEPNPHFIHRLRGRLVHVRGASSPNLWTAVVLGVGVMLVAAAWMGLALRLVLALVSALGLLSQRRMVRRTTRAVR